MSIYRVSPGDFDTFTVTTNPTRHYHSSSLGTQGSVHVFPRQTHVEKDISPSSVYVDLTHDDMDLNGTLLVAKRVGKLARELRKSGVVPSAITALSDKRFAKTLVSYMSGVTAQSPSLRKSKTLDVVRFVPPVSFGQDTVSKLIVKENLGSYYRLIYPSSHWGFTNYNTLNFYTSSNVPTSSVMLYPNVDTTGSQFHQGYVSGTFTPSGSFGFDFYVNPRYKQAVPDTAFKAGTILHLSSTFALSLVSGSLRDENGKAAAFRLQLQLSHSADIPPSLASHGVYPRDLVFLSDDNSLLYNNWHHVIVRWGTSQLSNGSGSFNIDGVDKGTFNVPSGTITPKLMDARGNPDVLCVGNFYEGNNTGLNAQALFFEANTAIRDGLAQIIDTGGSTDPDNGYDEPINYAFKHPLNAELHDLCIRRRYMSDDDIAVSASVGPSAIDDSFALYLPPFFTPTSPFRQFWGDHGGILQTPFFEVNGTSIDPFNVAMAFGVNGHYINTENFTYDFASGLFPRLHHMTGVALTNTTDAISANEFLYDQPFVVRRNTFLMPCDDGKFVPGFNLLVSQSNTAKYIDDLGSPNFSIVNLDNLVTPTSLLFGSDFDQGNVPEEKSNEFVNQAIGFTPEQPGSPPGPASTGYQRLIAKAVSAGLFEPGLQAGAPLTIYNRTRDPSSNQVTFFDMSNLFYGKQIKPASFALQDVSLSGSAGAINMTLKDDGTGGLYRADCLTPQATWNSVGTLYYDEGIAVVKNPNLNLIGRDGFSIDMKGTQNIHVLKIDVMAPANQLNSSSNPSYANISPSGYANDNSTGFVQISSVNFHDKNMNVVARTVLAQPVVKRFEERLVIRNKIDF